MSENYSEEMFDIVGRTRKILNLARVLYSDDEFKALKANAHNSVSKCKDLITDDLDLAICITNGGLMYRENNVIHNDAITKALLTKQIESAYGVKAEFMHRDENKQVTLYETFANNYFGKMFGENGYRQLFEGKGREFTEDFKKYGATEEEINKLEAAINNSIITGEYNLEDDRFMTVLCSKVSKNRITLGEASKMTASEIWEEAAYANPEIEVAPKKKTL